MQEVAGGHAEPGIAPETPLQAGPVLLNRPHQAVCLGFGTVQGDDDAEQRSERLDRTARSPSRKGVEQDFAAQGGLDQRLENLFLQGGFRVRRAHGVSQTCGRRDVSGSRRGCQQTRPRKGFPAGESEVDERPVWVHM